MATLTYTGGAFDHEVVPAKNKKGLDGKPIKRVYVREAETNFIELDVRKLWGHEFPLDVPVEVTDAALVRKAINLGHFLFNGPAEWLTEPPKRARDRRALIAAQKLAEARSLIRPAEAAGPQEGSVSVGQDKPRKAGRPRKEVVAE